MNAEELSEQSITFSDFCADSTEDEDVLDQFAEHLTANRDDVAKGMSYNDLIREWNKWV